MFRSRVEGLLLRSNICYKLLIRRGFIVKPPNYFHSLASRLDNPTKINNKGFSSLAESEFRNHHSKSRSITDVGYFLATVWLLF